MREIKTKQNTSVRINFSGGLANKLHASIKSMYLIFRHLRLDSIDFEEDWHN